MKPLIVHTAGFAQGDLQEEPIRGNAHHHFNLPISRSSFHDGEVLISEADGLVIVLTLNWLWNKLDTPFSSKKQTKV